MIFGLALAPEENPQDTSQLVKFAEEQGFAYAWILDSQLLMSDVYANLALCAIATRTIKLGTGVTNCFTRHPTVTANAIRSIDTLSNGRAVLGIGAGYSATANIRSTFNLSSFRDSVLEIRELLTGNAVNFGGKAVRLEQSYTLRKIPIYIAASRPRSLQLAGKIADGVIISAGSEPSLIKMAIDNVMVGVREAGRDPKEVELTCNVGCSVSTDGKKAKREARTFAARRAADMADRLPEKFAHLRETARRIKKAYEISGHMKVGSKHSTLVSDEMVDLFTISGTPAECIDRLYDISSTGINQIFAFLVTNDRLESIRLFGEQIIPTR